MATQAPNQPRAYSQAYLPNGATPSGPVPGAQPLLPNQGRVIQNGGARVLCIADVRGNLQSLNHLAKQAKADYVIHTGDFGFYDDRSLDSIAEKTLKHVAQYSPLLPEHIKNEISRTLPQHSIKDRFAAERLPLSELPLFLNGTYRLEVPVYAVWGACEDVKVLEKLRSGEHKVPNLNIIDEANSRLLEVGGIKLRLLGLGGAVVMHKLFDNGEGRTTIAGGQGTMWTTLLQMGELVDTANRVYDPTETRVFVTHASPAREGLLNQLSVILKSDFSISAGLHFRYGSSYNEFSVNPSLDHYRGKLAASKASFNDVWETVKGEVEPAVEQNELQKRLLNYATEVVDRMPSVANGGNPFGGGASAPNGGQVDESAFKNMWNFNLADAAFGWLVLDIEAGRIGTEMRAQGFNFAHRTGKGPAAPKPQGAPTGPATSSPAPTGGTLPTPSQAAPPAQPRTPGAPVPVPVNQVQQSRAPPQAATPAVNQQPASTNQQRQAGPTPVRPGGPSPAPQASPAAQKPTTPQPAPTNATADTKPNGTAPTPTTETQKPTPVSTPSAPEPERKPSSAIFLGGITDSEEAKLVFHEADRPKIQRIDRRSNTNYTVVHFSSPEEMKAILEKGADKGGKYPKQSLREYMDQRHFGGRGGYGGGARGGRGGGEQGYRSGGETGRSDSEGQRGGRGGRGGRGRGGDRGRGRGRGGPGKQDNAPATSGGDGEKASGESGQW
ncbi:hypothetical protein EV356DRAFT_468765 [Viridothelium virens]|uniref:Uncharacterized protein n=1 Tax=Viridothelium virens TaxID=1048519 RepID=A0A6A6H6E2_VIRVR|nr:hypothetical protein EV356DRAFT_468765 [Viridothelium virens]